MINTINRELIFEDRMEAGKMLAQKLISYKSKNPIVIALPRGGVPVAAPIAEYLNAKLDILVSKKIGAPYNPEFAIGAVTSFGDYIIADYATHVLEDEENAYFKEHIKNLIEECKEKEKRYRPQQCVQYSYENQCIILVDDGVATGMTTLAAIKSIKKQKPAMLVLAVPVISIEAYNEISKQVDKIETLKIPEYFMAVGNHYANFEAVTDEKVGLILRNQIQVKK